MHVIGYNSRLKTLRAAMLRVKLRHLDCWSQARAEKAARYDELLADVNGIQTPAVAEENSHIYHQYTLRVVGDRREELMNRLTECGIGKAVYYIRAAPSGMFFSLGLYCEGDLPYTEAARVKVLSLPIYPELEDEQIRIVVESVRCFLES